MSEVYRTTSNKIYAQITLLLATDGCNLWQSVACKMVVLAKPLKCDTKPQDLNEDFSRGSLRGFGSLNVELSQLHIGAVVQNALQIDRNGGNNSILFRQVIVGTYTIPTNSALEVLKD